MNKIIYAKKNLIEKNVCDTKILNNARFKRINENSNKCIK